MKKYIVSILALFLGCATLAARDEAPVLTVNAGGAIIVSNPSGKLQYKFSLSEGAVPGAPDEIIPEKGVTVAKSGIYNIRVSAHNAKGKKLAETLATYRLYTVEGSLGEDSKVTLAPGAEDSRSLAPFTAWNKSTEEELSLTRGSMGAYWKFDKKSGGGNIQQMFLIGLDIIHDSFVSFYIKERVGDGSSTKKVYLALGNIKASGFSMAKAFAQVGDFSAEQTAAGTRLGFRLANGSEARAWSVLEQGFRKF